MPIYQYQCDECYHQLEALQKMNAPKLVDCPECAAPALRKQVTAAAFKLKGTGWYETDFRNSGAKPENANALAANKAPTTHKNGAPAASEGAQQAAQTSNANTAKPMASATD